MALCNNLHKSQHLISRYFLVVLSRKFLKCFVRNHGDKSITLDTDTLDDFTTQLMQKKSDKWEIMRTRRKLSSKQAQFNYTSKIKENKIHVEYLDTQELNSLLRDAIEANNESLIKEIMNECLECKRLPALSIMLQTLSFYSQHGDRDTILNIVELCREVSPEMLKENSHFKHYLAEATWIKGNINEAIVLFEDVYRNNAYLRRRLRSMLKFLMLDTITNRSEAALLNIICFAERLVDDFRDFYPLACIWQACFLSEWFTDQCIALDLLKRKEGLCKAVAHQMPFVVALTLKNHQTEVVYRLLEVLLKLEQTSQYTRILEALFDYRVRRGDLRGCSEIIQWSLTQGVELPAVQEEKFVTLLVSYASHPTHTVETDVKPKSPSTPSYQFKF